MGFALNRSVEWGQIVCDFDGEEWGGKTAVAILNELCEATNTPS